MNSIDDIRNKIYELFDLDEQETKEVLEGVYSIRLKDRKLIPFFEIIYHTSYAINYYIKCTTNNPEAYYESLDDAKDIDDFLENMTFEEFYAYCDDVKFFHSLEKYKKKAFLNNALKKRKKISNVSRLYTCFNGRRKV